MLIQNSRSEKNNDIIDIKYWPTNILINLDKYSGAFFFVMALSAILARNTRSNYKFMHNYDQAEEKEQMLARCHTIGLSLTLTTTILLAWYNIIHGFFTMFYFLLRIVNVEPAHYKINSQRYLHLFMSFLLDFLSAILLYIDMRFMTSAGVIALGLMSASNCLRRSAFFKKTPYALVQYNDINEVELLYHDQTVDDQDFEIKLSIGRYEGKISAKPFFDQCLLFIKSIDVKKIDYLVLFEQSRIAVFLLIGLAAPSLALTARSCAALRREFNLHGPIMTTPFSIAYVTYELMYASSILYYLYSVLKKSEATSIASHVALLCSGFCSIIGSGLLLSDSNLLKTYPAAAGLMFFGLSSIFASHAFGKIEPEEVKKADAEASEFLLSSESKKPRNKTILDFFSKSDRSATTIAAKAEYPAL